MLWNWDVTLDKLLTSCVNVVIHVWEEAWHWKLDVFETGGLTWVEISLEKLHTFTCLFHLTKGALNQKKHPRSSSFRHKGVFLFHPSSFYSSLSPSICCVLFSWSRLASAHLHPRCEVGELQPHPHLQIHKLDSNGTSGAKKRIGE